MKNTIILCGILLFFFSLKIQSQVSQQWVARYNGPGSGIEEQLAMTVDKTGNVYVTGASYGTASYREYCTVKYNASGIQQWVQRYGYPGDSFTEARSIAVDDSGNVYITGSSWQSGTAYDIATIKYNTNGITQWVNRYNDPYNGYDDGYSVAINELGDIYVAGGSENSMILLKYNTAGVQQWLQTYRGPPLNGSNRALAIVLDVAGNIFITGTSMGNGTGWDYTTIKYNSCGVQQWLQCYNGPANMDDVARSIAVDRCGNVFVTGRINGNSNTTNEYGTVKYDSSGIQQWVQIYTGTQNSQSDATGLVLDFSGNVYVTGWSSTQNHQYDYGTIKYNTTGNQQWIQLYNGPSNSYDWANSIAIDVYGNVYVTGGSVDAVTSGDYLTVKYNSSGVQQWVQRYDGGFNGPDEAHSIFVDAAGNVYVSGTSRNDYATIKYSQSITGINPKTGEIPNSFSLYQNYPNPFNPSTKILYDLPKNAFVKLVVYDVLGREVKVLVNENKPAGSYQIEFDATNLPSGVYFYKLNAGDYTETRKMSLIK